jgi:hypothetical protein
MKIITRLLPLAVLIGIVIGFKLYSKHNASEEFRPTAASFVRAFPAYEANKAYFDLALEQFHSKAFDLAYRLGGRRTSASFDPDAYHAFLIAFIMRDAEHQGKSDIAASLNEHRDGAGLPEVEFE